MLEILHRCPKCGRMYSPKYPTKNASLAAGDKEALEQWISGICSSECWNTLTENEILDKAYP